MNRNFRKIVSSLEASLRSLLSMSPVKAVSMPTGMPVSGVYLFSERGRPLYIGRSNRLRDRIQRHSRPGASHDSAGFAFRLARRATGQMVASYKTKGSRKHLRADPTFERAFRNAKARIRLMDVRFVEENDQVRQTLLEIYAAVVLGTPHNDFGTH